MIAFFKKFFPKKDQKGFALFFAILISSVMLAIGLEVFNIAFKEVVLSSFTRDSQFAFYAADSGAECAEYWDIKQESFNPVGTRSISCNGQSFTVGGSAQTVFGNITFSPEGYCSIVTVTKSASTTGYSTVIDSRGYNTCAAGSSQRVERGIEIRY
jgi:Tfp pilus assembly protein PilX